MRRFLDNNKGAVTVLVTLLLIPAILASGTAVDLTRLYTSKSIMQDANQLAANSMLASYDAMLQDIYGLYGIMDEDKELGTMITNYASIVIYGENPQAADTGSFRLFDGNSKSLKVFYSPEVNQNLADPQVLRRQIEEYAKFRAPVIITEDVLKLLDTFDKIGADSAAIKEKAEIDAKIAEIYNIYKDIYNLINQANGYGAAQTSAFDSVNSYLTKINGQFKDMLGTRGAWESAFDVDDTVLQSDYETKYHGICINIANLVKGGGINTGWVPGSLDTSAGWSSSYRSTGLNQEIGNRKSVLNGYKTTLDTLVAKCQTANAKKQELSAMVDALEQKLKSGECSQELSDGLMKSQDGTPSAIEQYRRILKYDLTSLANQMRTPDVKVIDKAVGTLDGISYGNFKTGTPVISRKNLTNLVEIQGFDINLTVANRTLSGSQEIKDALSPLAMLGTGVYNYTAPIGFKMFSELSTEHATFYSELSNMFASGAGGSKDAAMKTLDKLFDTSVAYVDQIKKGYTNDVEGALKYTGAYTGSGSAGITYSAAWSKSGDGSDQIENNLDNNFLDTLVDLLGSAADKILLTTYSTEMFSCYTTNVPKNTDGNTGEKTMSGIPYGIDVNYFYQSEQEFLFNGNQKDANANLNSVTDLLMLVRLISNFVSSFSVTEVNTVVNSIGTAFSFLGPFSILVSGAARLVIAYVESAIDVGLLRSGQGVPFVKNNATWNFKVSGLVNSTAKTLVDISSKFDTSVKTAKGDGEGLFYKDYLRLFLLTVNGDTLAKRVSFLIALNITNKKQNINASETAMKSAKIFDMSKAMTGFSITSKADLRMLFLSMPFAQKGINGVVPPKALPVSVTDYRGY